MSQCLNGNALPQTLKSELGEAKSELQEAKHKQWAAETQLAQHKKASLQCMAALWRHAWCALLAQS